MASQKETLEVLVAQIASMQAKLPNGEMLRMEISLQKIAENQHIMQSTLDTLNRVITDPTDGLIVNTNKNTDFRTTCEPDREATLDAFKGVLRWKNNLDKAMWVLFSAVVGIIVKIAFFA